MKGLLCRLFGHRINTYWAIRASNTPVAMRCHRCGQMVPMDEWP